MRKLAFICACLIPSLWATSAGAAIYWWDPNGTTSVGGNGTWDTTTAEWANTGNTLGSQTTSLVAWNATSAAGFCAGPSGSTSQGTFTITVNTSIGFAGIFNGPEDPGPCTVTITGSGSLNLASGIQGFDTHNSAVGFTHINVPITGSGNVCPQNSGQLYLDAVNTYSGGTALGYSGSPFNGLVNFNNGSSFGSGPITLSNCAGGALVCDVTTAVTIPNAVTCPGTGQTMNIVGTAAGTTFSGPWTLGSTPGIGVGGTGNLVTISGAISGAGGFTKYNPSTLVLSGANSYTGITTISNGVLSVTTDNNLGAAPASPIGDILISGGTLNASNTFTLNANRLTSLSGTATISVSTGKTLTYLAQISGASTLAKSGAGTLALKAANGYTGATTIASGILEADSQGGSAVGTNTVSLQSGAILSGTGIVSGAVSGAGSIAPGTAAGPGTLTLGNGLNLGSGGTYTWNLAANNTSSNYSVISLIGGNLALGGTSKLSINFSGTATAPANNNPFWMTQEAWTVVTVSGSAGDTGMTTFSSLVNGNYAAGTFSNYASGNGNIVLLYKPNFAVFDALYDSGPGFFAGENLIFTNFSGLSLFVWSSTNASLSVSNWSLVGPMQEQPLAPALPGYSRYSINVVPTASPTYYVAGNTNAGPYVVSPVPAAILTTPDYVDFSVLNTNVAISASGVLPLP